jgi:hypothetical protein
MDGDKDMRDLKSAVEKLQSEMEWVKVVLSGQRPQDADKKTSPPWLTAAGIVFVPIVTAVIATKPWG